MSIYIQVTTYTIHMTTQNTTKTIQKNNHPVDEYHITPTIQQLQLYHQWTHSTYKNYKATLTTYCKYQQMTLPALINEAEEDEETTPKVNKRHIRDRLIRYILHLQQEGYQTRTINHYLNKIKRVYKHYNIEIPDLPRLGRPHQEHYEDLPTREQIQYVLQHTYTKTRALVTFLASTGMRISDASLLTINDFMQACHDSIGYTRSIMEFLMKIQKYDNTIIPTWHIQNKKTRQSYVTFSSDESTRYIAQYLLEYMKNHVLYEDDLLFHMTSQSMSIHFRRVNDRCGLGNLESRCRFHPHSLRKFFATTLTNADMDFLSVEFMLGHSLDTVKEAYYKADPERLKLKYSMFLEHLTFLEEVTYREVSSGELEELEELRQYRRDTDEKLARLEQMLDLLSMK